MWDSVLGGFMSETTPCTLSDLSLVLKGPAHQGYLINLIAWQTHIPRINWYIATHQRSERERESGCRTHQRSEREVDAVAYNSATKAHPVSQQLGKPLPIKPKGATIHKTNTHKSLSARTTKPRQRPARKPSPTPSPTPTHSHPQSQSHRTAQYGVSQGLDGCCSGYGAAWHHDADERLFVPLGVLHAVRLRGRTCFNRHNTHTSGAQGYSSIEVRIQACI